MRNEISAYLRSDGTKGVRNHLVVVYLVECSKHVADEITRKYANRGVHLIGFSGCYPNEYSNRMLQQLCTHPNVWGALLVSLGCEGFDRHSLMVSIKESGRPVEVIGVQDTGGTMKTIERGCAWVENALAKMEETPRVPMSVDELVVGTICGGSDASSGITANPGIGRCIDRIVENGGRAIFEETGELIGCEEIMANRAAHPELKQELLECVDKAARYYEKLGHGSFAPGNADGGLTTQEEKSMGAYAKSGNSLISGILKPGDRPAKGGLYLLDVVPDGEVRFGFPNINDTTEIVELIACGSHIVLFSTGRGSVVGSAISPVIKICGNPETYRKIEDDMDVNAGRILQGKGTLDEIGDEIHNKVIEVANGVRSASERLGHQEFALTYKSFEPIGPNCYPR